MKAQSLRPKMMMLPAKPGTCAMCATEHDESMPHNYWSIFYQMRFKAKYGRDATHADALAHLSAEYRTRAYESGQVKNMGELQADFARVRDEYKRHLTRHGEQWNEPADGTEPIAEAYAESDPL